MSSPLCHVWGTGEVHTRFWWGKLKTGDHLEDQRIHRRIVLKRIFERCDGGMDWIDLAQDRDRWRVLANAVMNIRDP